MIYGEYYKRKATFDQFLCFKQYSIAKFIQILLV